MIEIKDTIKKFRSMLGVLATLGESGESNNAAKEQLRKELADVQKKIAKIQKMKAGVSDDWPELKKSMNLKKWAKVLIGEDVLTTLTESGSGSIKWKMNDKNGFVNVTVDGIEYKCKVMWAPSYGTGKKSKPFHHDINFIDKSGRVVWGLYGARNPKGFEGWPKFKSYGDVPKSKIKQAISSQFDKMISELESSGHDVKVG